MTSFKSPPPIEPLGDLSWRRVQHAVFTELSQGSVGAQPVGSRRWFWVGGSLLVAAAASVAAIVLIGGPPSESQAKVAPGTSDAVKKDSPPAIRTSRFVTDSDSATISLADSSLVLRPDSALLVNESASETQLVLERGQVTCSVEPRPLDRPFVVIAGSTRVQVVGTKFSVERQGDRAKVVVQHGRVLAFEGGEKTALGPGDTWPRVAAATHRHRNEKAQANRRQTPARPRVSPKELYRQAAGLEAASPSEAAAIYRRLEKRGGSWAKTALFARARLAVEHGNRELARTLLDRYLERYPAAINAADARALRSRLR